MILIQPSIDPVIFSFSFLEIRWYSLAYVAGFLIGLYLIKLLNQKNSDQINNKQIDNFLIWSVIGVIIGGRFGYVLLYQIEIFFKNPFYLFYIWEGGMSFHGGLLGIIISIYFFSKKNDIQFFYLSDFVSLVAPIGIFFGRIANFINIELIGRKTDFPFAIIYPSIDNFPRHPSQLYEAFFEGIVLFIILLYIFFKKNSKRSYGNLSAFFLIFYGLFRFLIEFLREPDQHIGLIFNYLTLGQILSIPLVLFGILILFLQKQNVKK